MLALPAVVDPRRAHLDHAGPRRHLPGPGVPVGDHQALAHGVELLGMGLEVGPALGQKRHGQHVLGGHPTQLVEADRHGLGVTHHVAVVSPASSTSCWPSTTSPSSTGSTCGPPTRSSPPSRRSDSGPR